MQLFSADANFGLGQMSIPAGSGRILSWLNSQLEPARLVI